MGKTKRLKGKQRSTKHSTEN